MGNHSEGGLPDCAEQDTEKQWFREAQEDICQVSRPSHGNTVVVEITLTECSSYWSLFFPYRVDGVMKHLIESRDFDHRLRALENEVKLHSFIAFLSLALQVFTRTRTCLMDSSGMSWQICIWWYCSHSTFFLSLQLAEVSIVANGFPFGLSFVPEARSGVFSTHCLSQKYWSLLYVNTHLFLLRWSIAQMPSVGL